MQFEVNERIPEKNKIEYTVSQMIALMNDTDRKADAMKNQKWYQKMLKTVLGKNKATKEEIVENHDKLNAYMAETIAELYRREAFDNQTLVTLGAQINQVYSNIPEIKEILYNTALSLNSKIESLDSFVVLNGNIDVGKYNNLNPLVSICEIISKLDERILNNEEKMDILRSKIEQTGCIPNIEKSLSELTGELLSLSESDANEVYSDLIAVGTDSFWVSVFSQLIEQYHFLAPSAKKAVKSKVIADRVLLANDLEPETCFSYMEIFDDLVVAKREMYTQCVYHMESVPANEEKLLIPPDEVVESESMEVTLPEEDSHNKVYEMLSEGNDTFGEKISSTDENIDYQNDGFPEIKISIFLDRKEGKRNRVFLNQYLHKILQHEIKPEPYFKQNEDGEVYYLLKEFLESNIPSEASDNKLFSLCRFFNVLNRQVNNDMYAKYDTLADKMNAKKIREAYNRDEKIWIKPTIYKKKIEYIGRNPLKEAAWVVVHSYLIDVLFSENYQYRLIPKKKELIPKWNKYIKMMEDVPNEVKQCFILDMDGESEFTRYYLQK